MYNTFITGDFQSRKPYRFSDSEYAQVLNNIVIACVDVAVIDNKNRLLLGKRAYEPAKGYWWIIGGRMIPGESFQEAASRAMKRELNLNINHKRFKFVATYNYLFSLRAQEPMNLGAQTVSITMATRLTDKETAALTPNEEYSEMVWQKLTSVAKNVSGVHHSGIIQTAKDFLKLLRVK